MACGGGGEGGKTTKLFGVTVGKATPANGGSLVLLSPDDGSLISSVGPVGYFINGLEYDHVSNKLYGTTSNKDPVFPDGLIQIDMQTAAATTIGASGMMVSNPTVNSTGEMLGFSQNSGEDTLITFDIITGVAATIGNPGLRLWENGLAFDSEDTLYLVHGNGEIYTIDAADGSATFMSSIGTRAHHGDFHPETGYYWGIDETYNSIGYSDAPRDLLVVDFNTPAIISTLSTVNDLHAVTFYYD